VRILLALRKEHRQPPGEGAGADTPSSAGDSKAGADTGCSVCDSGQDVQTRRSLRETQTPNDRGLRQPATESLEEENAGETPKSAEQSQNVIENKGPAAEGVVA